MHNWAAEWKPITIYVPHWIERALDEQNPKGNFITLPKSEWLSLPKVINVKRRPTKQEITDELARLAKEDQLKARREKVRKQNHQKRKKSARAMPKELMSHYGGTKDSSGSSSKRSATGSSKNKHDSE